MDQAPEKLQPSIRPESLLEFRLAQLLLLFEVAAAPEEPLDLDRLGYYDFFAANPFLVVGASERSWVDLKLAGFSPRSLDYQSSAQRFANRRQRLKHDIAVLVGMNLVEAQPQDGLISYQTTQRGRSLGSSLHAVYAASYRASASIVVKKLSRLSDSRLRQQAEEWLRAESLLIDLYD